MLDEYFGIQISEAGLVESLPLLLPGYTPNIDLLPAFLMHLGPRVSIGTSFQWMRLIVV
jgi:DNA mismatch repair protein MLH1